MKHKKTKPARKTKTPYLRGTLRMIAWDCSDATSRIGWAHKNPDTSIRIVLPDCWWGVAAQIVDHTTGRRIT